MQVLGIRCSNRDYSYAILGGTRSSPILADSGTVAFPVGFQKPQSLHWLLQEAEGIIQKHGVVRIAIKAHEGRTKGTAYENRVEHEAAVTLSGAISGPIPVFKKRKSTIAKDLGLKGRAQYLSTKLDTSAIPGFSDLKEKQQEAVLVAWSELPDGG